MINKEEKVNYFLKPIYNKNNKGLINRMKSYIKYKLFIKNLSKITPNFDMLLEIYDFLETLKIVYMYNVEMEHCKLYSSMKNSEKCIVFDPGKGFNVRIHLTEISRTNKIKISRITDINIKKGMVSEIVFKDGEATISDINEEYLFINVINYIMDSVVELVKYYYKNKRKGY